MANETPHNSSAGKRWYSRILFIVVLSGVSFYVYTALKDLAGFNYRLDWAYLFLSFFFTVIAYLIHLIIWIYLARSFGIKFSFLSAANAWSLSQLGKYVPGKIGLLLIRMDIHSEVSKSKIAVATGVEFITTMTASCLLVLLSVAFIPELVSYSLRLAALGLALIFLLILYPPV
ncbi:MAG TPA: hypothetical protein PKO34_09220, partial [Smithellaceae bacterium]|nr:hypothetical protein [Smithellaceae bacterium]